MGKKKLIKEKEMDGYFKEAVKYAKGDLWLAKKISNVLVNNRKREQWTHIEEYANSKNIQVTITKEILSEILNSYVDGDIDEEDLHFYGRMIFNSHLRINVEYDERFGAEIDEVIMRLDCIDSDGFDKKEAKRLLKLLGE